MITSFNHFLNENEALGLDIYTPEELGDMLLVHCSNADADLNTVQSLVDHGAYLETRTTKKGAQTSLHMAAIYNRLDIVMALIKAGADINTKDDNEMTPLHWAARYGYRELTQALIKAGADVNTQDKKANTPLHDAASDNYEGITRYLLEAGATKDVKNNDGKTPWDVASYRIRTRIPELKPD